MIAAVAIVAILTVAALAYLNGRATLAQAEHMRSIHTELVRANLGRSLTEYDRPEQIASQTALRILADEDPVPSDRME